MNPNHDDHGRFSEGGGSGGGGAAAHANVPRESQFQAARAKQAQLEAESTRLGRAMNAFPKGPMNLTPDSVRATPEWKAAKAASDKSFQAYRNFNGMMLKAFPKELQAERAAKRR